MKTHGQPELPRRDAQRISDRRLTDPAISFMVHVPTLVGARWVAANRKGILAAGGDPDRIAATFSSGLMGFMLMDQLELGDADVEPEILATCLDWIRRLGRSTSKPSLDLFFSEGHAPNGDHGFIVTLSPPPSNALQRALVKRFGDARSSTPAPVVRLGARPVLRVVRGHLACWWEETVAFRRRASRLRSRAIRAYWDANGWTGRLPPDPYVQDHDAYARLQAGTRRAVRRAATEEIRPLLEGLGIFTTRA